MLQDSKLKSQYKHKKSQIKHSNKTQKNISKSTLTNCDGYSFNTKLEYHILFKYFFCFAKKKDWEMTHSFEDIILEKFINEIIQNKYKTKEDILTRARMINEKILTKAYPKWYA